MTMHRIALAFLAWLSLAAPAAADYVIRDGGNVNRTIDAFRTNSSTKELPKHAPTDANGATLAGSSTGGTAAASSLLIGGIYRSSLPTLTTGQQTGVTFDVNGRLLVSGSIAAGAQVDLLTMRGTKAAGTAAANSLLTGGVYNSSGITLTDGQQAATQLDASGNLKVNVTGATGVGATGSAPPANAVNLGANSSGATGGLMAGLIQCDSSAVYDASTSGSTELKALTSGRSVYVCGYSIMAGGTVNVKLITGTGTACATGAANITPAFQLTAQAGVVDGSPFYRGLKGAAAGALCINTSAGIAVQAIIYYAVL